MKYLIVFLFLFANSIALAEISSHCGRQKASDQSYDYCVRTNPASHAVIYFFHGLMGDENSYHKVISAFLDPIWEKQGIPLPNVINISFGRTWLMSEAEGGKQYYKTFSEIIQPTLEKQFGFDSSYRRLLVGMSMGGFNAAEAFAKAPDKYEKAAFLCPALHTISPYASEEEIDAFIERTGAQRQLVKLSQDIGRSEFTTAKAWDLENPFAVSLNITAVGIPLFVAVGDEDQFGFQEGAQAFADLMQKKSPRVDFYLIKGGGHCSFPTQELAKYLASSLK